MSDPKIRPTPPGAVLSTRDSRSGLVAALLYGIGRTTRAIVSGHGRALKTLERIASNMPKAVFRFSNDGVTQYCNPAALELCCQLLPDAASVNEILPPGVWGAIGSLVATGEEYRRLSYTIGPRSLTCDLHRISEAMGVHAILSDVTRRRQLQEQLTLQATTDWLTGLRNRACLYDDMKDCILQAEARAERLVFMSLDIDRFKNVNDSLGHAVGDNLLRQVAARLRRAVGGHGCLWRLGGDEFALLLEGLHNLADAKAFAGGILGMLRAPFIVGPHEFYMTASIGITMFPEDGDDPDLLMRNADTSMYQAKRQGRNGYSLFTTTLSSQVKESMCLEQRLRRAIRRDEFVLHYQPQIDLGTSTIVGREALLRWKLAGSDDVPVSRLISLAEETGLILPIGDWVLSTACRQNKQWQAAGHPHARVAVNISVRQLQQHDFVQVVRAALDASGLEPQYLELEITETAAMEQVDATVAMLRQLRGLDVCLSIDDFGIGHSSLAYLQQLPVDRIKIDRSFLNDPGRAVPEDLQGRQDNPIVNTIIDLAHSLGLRALAEGVESESMAQYLAARGCDEAQGYFFGRPVSAEHAMQQPSESRGVIPAQAYAD